MRPFRFVAVAALSALAVVAGTVSIASSHANPVAGSEQRSDVVRTERPVGVRTVTLLTGDRVRLTYFHGEAPRVHVTPGEDRNGVAFSIRRRGESVSVVPSDVAPTLTRGSIDPRLFDVTGLVEQGYDDARSQRLPLIVERPTVLSPLLEGTILEGPVGGLGMSVLKPLKRDVDDLWRSVARTGQGRRGPGTPDESRRPSAKGWDWMAMASRIWLDGKVHKTSTDDKADKNDKNENEENSGPVRGLASWQRGFDGTGVKIAVLDSGIDTAHPDLRGVVADQRDFTAASRRENAHDDLGHGTHVASTIAGTGAASEGRYRGVAPGSRLLVGKVLDASGAGVESSVIAGMEWAIGRGAKVINLSLGNDVASDGKDPLSETVNRLSERAVFVVASGNSGPKQGTVGSPGAATKALTVGAVDSKGNTGPFSSRGPRRGDFAAKPDIAAPGVDVVGARARGTKVGPKVGTSYAKLSGTSMAAPYISGTLAMLAEANPGWSSDDLRAGLMGSAKPTGSVFEQGAGVVDIAAAVRQNVFATTPSISAFLKWPHGRGVESRTLTYRNKGDFAETLDLRIEGGSGVIGLGAESVTVMPGRTARVPLRFLASKGKSGGLYPARVVASDGRTTVRTPVSAYVEPESYDVKAEILDRAGRLLRNPERGFQYQPMLKNLLTGKEFPLRTARDGLTARVPRGRYSLTEIISTPRSLESPTLTVVSAPELDVERNRAVRLDAREANPVRARVDSGPTQPVSATFGIVEKIAGKPWETLATATDSPKLYALATDTVRDRPYAMVLHSALAATRATYEVLVGEEGRIPRETEFDVANDDLVRLTTDFGAPGVAQQGEWYHGVQLGGEYGTAFSTSFPTWHPGRREHYLSTHDPAGRDLTWFGSVDLEHRGKPSLTMYGPMRTYEPGKGRQVWAGGAYGPRATVFVDRAPTGPPYVGVTAGPQTPSTGGDFEIYDPHGISGTLTLSKSGRVVGKSKSTSFVRAPVREGGRYAVRLAARSKAPWSAYATTVRGRWTFDVPRRVRPASTSEPRLLRPRLTGPFDALGRAQGGKRARLQLTVPGVARTPSFEMSYDDGETWRRMPLRPAGKRAGAWWADVAHPSDVAYASWRLSARGESGNSVAVTSIRSYGLIMPQT